MAIVTVPDWAWKETALPATRPVAPVTSSLAESAVIVLYAIVPLAFVPPAIKGITVFATVEIVGVARFVTFQDSGA
jgi:hypothetical protein